jgi:hypothetical protein
VALPFGDFAKPGLIISTIYDFEALFTVKLKSNSFLPKFGMRNKHRRYEKIRPLISDRSLTPKQEFQIRT